MKCFECGGAVIQTRGSVRMTKKDGTLIIFNGVPLSQCHQCGEQYIAGEWAEKIGEMLRKEDQLIPREVMSVPVITLGPS